jgi:Fic family protein
MSGWSEQVTAAVRTHYPDIIDHPPVAHRSEQRSYKALVGGSIPPWRTKHLKRRIIMEALAEKYLSSALEGAEQATQQIDQAIAQLEAQLEKMQEQRSEVGEAVSDLKQLLGLEEEDVDQSEEV